MTTRILRSATLLTAPLLLACGFLAQADQWDKRTKITVNEAIEVPGTVLPAGTYIFRLLDSPSDRHVVQIFNEREDHIFATVIAIPNLRLTPTGKTVLSFYEVPAGEPQPVRAWFYPGDDFGQEFVYANEHKVVVSQDASAVTTTNPVVAVETLEPVPSATVVAQVDTTPAPVATTPAPEVIIAANEPPPAPVAAMPVMPVMPQTATNVPLFMLLGLLSIGAAVTLGSFAKRVN